MLMWLVVMLRHCHELLLLRRLQDMRRVGLSVTQWTCAEGLLLVHLAVGLMVVLGVKKRLLVVLRDERSGSRVRPLLVRLWRWDHHVRPRWGCQVVRRPRGLCEAPRMITS